MSVLEVAHLCKKYPAFALCDVSFSLERGKITGFIGRNGAGKSTTLNSLFHFVHPDSGEIRFFGQDICTHEMEIKQNVGFVSGAVDYYAKKKLKSISAITRSFYEHWDDDAYARYMKLFLLDESKTPSQLSAGMKVKYALALALSHNAELLILDEPTSGLDPISRDELLEIFMNLCDEGKTILFSTHITSDLDKCADYILYIKNGRIQAQSAISDFINTYRVVEYPDSDWAARQKIPLIGCKRGKTGFTALVRAEDASRIDLPCIKSDLESVMIHLEKEESPCESF